MDISDAKQIYFVRLTEKISKQIMLNILSWMKRDKDIDRIADIAEFVIKILKDEWSLAFDLFCFR